MFYVQYFYSFCLPPVTVVPLPHYIGKYIPMCAYVSNNQLIKSCAHLRDGTSTDGQPGGPVIRGCVTLATSFLINKFEFNEHVKRVNQGIIFFKSAMGIMLIWGWLLAVSRLHLLHISNWHTKRVFQLSHLIAHLYCAGQVERLNKFCKSVYL